MTRYNKKPIDDYVRDVLSTNNIVRIKGFSNSIYLTIYELTDYGSKLVQSDEIFVKN